jgi:hypothetical protein
MLCNEISGYQYFNEPTTDGLDLRNPISAKATYRSSTVALLIRQ